LGKYQLCAGIIITLILLPGERNGMRFLKSQATIEKKTKKRKLCIWTDWVPWNEISSHLSIATVMVVPMKRNLNFLNTLEKEEREIGLKIALTAAYFVLD